MIRILNLIFFTVMIVVNYLANALPLNHRTTGQISDAIPNLFVPAGITFAIWGIIYLLLLACCIIQFRPQNNEIASATGREFILTCILNSLWIVFWHYGLLPLTLVVMAGLLVTLIRINRKIRALPPGIIKASFGVYLGWICIATIANVTALLVHYNWQGFGISEEAWTIVMISAGAIIAGLALLDLRNPFIGLSVIWAFAGIILKRHYDYRSIAITAGICILIVTAATLFAFIRKDKGKGSILQA